MKIVTKKELLELPPYTIFRAWQHDVWDYVDWEVKTGKDFGSIELSPDARGVDNESVENVTDWDGQLDLDDNQLYAVLEKKDILLMQSRLSLALEKGDPSAVSAAGREPWEV